MHRICFLPPPRQSLKTIKTSIQDNDLCGQKIYASPIQYHFLWKQLSFWHSFNRSQKEEDLTFKSRKSNLCSIQIRLLSIHCLPQRASNHVFSTKNDLQPKYTIRNADELSSINPKPLLLRHASRRIISLARQHLQKPEIHLADHGLLSSTDSLMTSHSLRNVQNLKHNILLSLFPPLPRMTWSFEFNGFSNDLEKDLYYLKILFEKKLILNCLQKLSTNQKPL